MPTEFTYYCSAVGKRRDFRYQHATPESAKARAASTINSFGLTNAPMSSQTLKGILSQLEKVTGVKLSYSRIYREVVEGGVSATVVPAWEALKQHYEPMDVAVIMISRAEVTA